MEAHRDRALAEAVRQHLMLDSRIGGEQINVVSTQGYIQLTGYVETEEHRRLAVELARGVMGVRHIEDRLQIRRHQAA